MGTIPQIVQPRAWDDIEQHYVGLNDAGSGRDSFLKLVRHIRSSGLSSRLLACTSLDKLIISIYDPIEWNREALHIDFDHQTQKWHFEYHPRPFEKTEFERDYDCDKGIEKFESFIKLIGW